MFALVWGALTSKIAGPIFGASALVLLILCGVERVQLAAVRLQAKQLTASLAGAKADLDICHANVKKEKQAIADQNASVDAAKRISDAKTAALAATAKRATQGRAAAQAQVKAIEALKPAGAQSCPAVDAVILGPR